MAPVRAKHEREHEFGRSRKSESLRIFLAPGGIAQLHRMALGLAAALFVLLGYRLGIAFDHFGTALAFGPAGSWALGWGPGVVGSWAGAGWQSNLMKGRRFADYGFQAGGPRASVKCGMVLCWDC